LENSILFVQLVSAQTTILSESLISALSSSLLFLFSAEYVSDLQPFSLLE